MIFFRIARILTSKKAIFFLVLIMLTTSAAFAVTSSILLSVDNTASGVLGESPNTIVIAQANARAPFLGIVPLALADYLGSVSGVQTISPEVFAPATLSNQAVMVRGVEPAQFMELQNPLILEGSPMAANDTDGVVDVDGEVFHYPGLYVVDGAAMPGPVGPNPSFTIAAFADHVADGILSTVEVAP